MLQTTLTWIQSLSDWIPCLLNTNYERNVSCLEGGDWSPQQNETKLQKVQHVQFWWGLKCVVSCMTTQDLCRRNRSLCVSATDAWLHLWRTLCSQSDHHLLGSLLHKDKLIVGWFHSFLLLHDIHTFKMEPSKQRNKANSVHNHVQGM